MPASRIERAAERRTDADALAGAGSRRRAALYVDRRRARRHAQDTPRTSIRCSRARRRMRSGDVPRPPSSASWTARRASRLRSSRRRSRRSRRDDAFEVTDLRTIAVRGLVDGRAPAAARRRQVAAASGMRGSASAPTAARQPRSVEAGWRRDCPACKMQHFPRTDPVVIMLAVDGERCLLGRSGRFADKFLVVPRGLRRAGRDDRGRGAARGPRGGRHRLRRR